MEGFFILTASSSAYRSIAGESLGFNNLIMAAKSNNYVLDTTFWTRHSRYFLVLVLDPGIKRV